MLPISALRSCRARDLPFGAFAWLTSGDQETLIVADQKEPFAVLLQERPVAVVLDRLDGDALFTTDWQIEIDPRSAKSADHINHTGDLLFVGKSKLFMRIKFDDDPRISVAALPLADGIGADMQRTIPFSRWNVVTMIGNKRYVLLEMPSQLSELKITNDSSV